MLSKEYRLNRKAFFQVKKSGTKLSFPNLKLIFLPNQLPHGRFSVVVSKQYSKSAVVRNRFRRQIYNTLSPSHLALSADFIIYPYNEKAISGLSQAILGIATC